MKHLSRIAITSILAFNLLACGSQRNFAPVASIAYLEPMPASGKHRVVAGETLYEIAWRYGLDYRKLAEYNHLAAPYTVYPNEELSLKLSSKVVKRALVSIPNNALPKSISAKGWVWPARGKLTSTFGKAQKGINIAGVLGSPIRATMSGRVVYAGNGLRGYGNLILIQHDETYLSAYAHNRALHVKQGQWVKKGQIIADMGAFGAMGPTLHFEIRKAGKPVNPLKYMN